MKYLFIALLLVPVALACVVPQDGMLVDHSVQFCSDVYYFDKGISITGNDIELDCNGAVLKSWKGGKGISVEHSSNITVTNCRVVNYNTGFYVRNSTRVFLEDNHLVRNKVGTRFVVVSESATFNHDVSLQAAFEIFESEGNAISLTNRRVSGDFCQLNFCNERRNAVFLFAQPKTTVPELHNWLLDQLTGRKSVQRLYDWVFSTPEFVPR
jgi:parallel beta-helix repeat protein